MIFFICIEPIHRMTSNMSLLVLVMNFNAIAFKISLGRGLGIIPCDFFFLFSIHWNFFSMNMLLIYLLIGLESPNLFMPASGISEHCIPDKIPVIGIPAKPTHSS